MADSMAFVFGDDPTFRRQVARMLWQTTGLHAISMAGGEAALAWTRATRPAMVLTSLRMRPLDGCELARRLKACPDTRAIPVVALGDLGPESDAAARAAGCDGVVGTPVDPAELGEVVRSCLAAARHSATRAAR